MRIVVHLGPAKTGSFSIQRTLAKHRRGLLERGVLYPETTQGTRSHNILNLGCSKYSGLSRGLKNRYPEHDSKRIERFRAECDYLQEQIRRHSPSEIVISSEWLARKADVLGCDFWQALFPDATGKLVFFAFARDPSKRFRSRAQQLLKHSGEFNFSRRPPLIRPFIEDLEQQFPGQVLVKPFEMMVSEGWDITQYLLTSAIPEKDFRWVKTLPGNETMSAEGMEILQNYRRVNHPDSNNVAQTDGLKLLEALARNGEMGRRAVAPKLHDSIEASVYTQLADEFRWLADHYDPRIADAIDYSKVSSGSEIDLRTITEVGQLCQVDRDRVRAIEARLMRDLIELAS